MNSTTLSPSSHNPLASYPREAFTDAVRDAAVHRMIYLATYGGDNPIIAEALLQDEERFAEVATEATMWALKEAAEGRL